MTLPPKRDGTPVPGLTVSAVVGQLTWRVLGPLKGRAKSVLDWAGLREQPPGTQREVARRYFVTQRAVGQRVQRVAAEGARLPLSDALLDELSRRTDRVRIPRSGGGARTYSGCRIGDPNRSSVRRWQFAHRGSSHAGWPPASVSGSTAVRVRDSGSVSCASPRRRSDLAIVEPHLGRY